MNCPRCNYPINKDNAWSNCPKCNCRLNLDTAPTQRVKASQQNSNTSSANNQSKSATYKNVSSQSHPKVSYCMRCGQKIEDEQKYCFKCGSAIHNPNGANYFSPTPKNLPQKKVWMFFGIAVATISVIVLIIIIVSANNSLESKLTKHTWYNEYQDSTIHFYSNGTYLEILKSGNTRDGKWSVTGNQLKMKGYTFDWWENLSDTDISRNLAYSEPYSWYVSNHYFVYCGDSVIGSDRVQIFRAQ